MGSEVIDRLIFALDGDLSQLKKVYSEAEAGASRAGQNIAANLERALRTGTAGLSQSTTGFKSAADSADVFKQASGLAAEEQRKLAAQLGLTTPAVNTWKDAFRSAAAVIGVFSLVQIIRDLAYFEIGVIKSAANLDNQAKTLGISTNALQAYHIAAIESGLGAEAGDQAIRRFTRSIGEAFETVGPTTKAFGDLGITAADLAGGTEAALPKVAAALLKIKDATERARIEQVLFGRSGQVVEALLKMWADPRLTDNLTKFNSLTQEQIEILQKSTIIWAKFWEVVNTGFAKATVYSMQFLKSGIWNLPLGVGPEGVQMLTPNPMITAARAAHIPYSPYGGDVTGTTTKGPAPKFPTPNMDKFIADSKIAVELAGLLGTDLEVAKKEIEAANAIIADQGQQDKIHISSLEQARRIIGATNDAMIERNRLAASLNAILDVVPDTTEADLRREEEIVTRDVEARARVQTESILKEQELRDTTDLRNEALREQIGFAQKDRELRFADASVRAKEIADLEAAVQLRQEGWTKDKAGYEEALVERKALLESMAALQTETNDEAMWGNFREGLVGVLSSGIHGFHSLADAARNFLSQLAEMSVQLFIIRPLLNAAFGTGPNIGGIVGSLLGIPSPGGFATVGAGGTWTPGPQGFPGRASGGNIDPGKFYVVGEHGPELLGAGAAGYVTPLQAPSGYGQGSANMNITHQYSIQVSGVGDKDLMSKIQTGVMATAGAMIQNNNDSLRKTQRSSLIRANKRALP